MNKLAEIIEIGIPINDDETGETNILLRPNEVKLLEKELKKYSKLQQELQRKDNNWNELKKWLNEPQITYNLDASEFGIEKIECVSIKDVLDKIKELESK